jgi:hypothetical protein
VSGRWVVVAWTVAVLNLLILPGATRPVVFISGLVFGMALMTTADYLDRRPARRSG